MSEQTPVTTLTCLSCGGRLQISRAINRFACGYCGNEQIVHRESGIVYLEPIAEDVHHIRTGVEGIRGGVDRTASELAIARLNKELSDLETELKDANKQNVFYWKPRSPEENAFLYLSIIFLFSAIYLNHFFVWLIFLCSFFCFLYLSHQRDRSAHEIKHETIRKTETRIRETKAGLDKNRKILT